MSENVCKALHAGAQISLEKLSSNLCPDKAIIKQLKSHQMFAAQIFSPKSRRDRLENFAVKNYWWLSFGVMLFICVGGCMSVRLLCAQVHARVFGCCCSNYSIVLCCCCRWKSFDAIPGVVVAFSLQFAEREIFCVSDEVGESKELPIGCLLCRVLAISRFGAICANAS